jgi:hypothetical protein
MLITIGILRKQKKCFTIAVIIESLKLNRYFSKEKPRRSGVSFS